ncbi:hypothetical protein [Roseateles koreensis]|uniref:Membrane-anchored ribosome-binding protein, inhibits growth in stationary phase, ElaB/YqjD/DUF883 family n=1 Tax=Roseateles koreensis TaxID=2987526 RepID=A0ABT5KTS3_9BURK|nr:hypothetical protein [Roseateles koreensis]MDC8785182.1 hypothetical protein [Roseateles koreensis]
MFETHKPTSAASKLDHSSQSGEQAFQATKELTQEAFNDLAEGAQELQQEAGAQISSMAKQTMDSVRDQSRRIREQAARLSVSTTHYIRDEPIKSVLMAAASGAVLMALIRMMSRSRG